VRILFVCISNICRSPYAEYVFNRMVPEDPALSGLVEWVRSGAVSFAFCRISRKTRSSLMAEGFTPAEIDRHRPRTWLFAPRRFSTSDVIIGMTRLQRWLLPFWWRKKYITLSEAATGTYAAIPDPVRLGQREFDSAMLVIKDYLVKLKGRLPVLSDDLMVCVQRTPGRRSGAS
jgi:protein-tyrosine phosphatase